MVDESSDETLLLSEGIWIGLLGQDSRSKLFGLKVNVEISTFGGRSQGLPRGRNISSSAKGRIVLPL